MPRETEYVFSFVRLQAQKIRATIRIAKLAANPILRLVFPNSLVNWRRFDKAARTTFAMLFGVGVWRSPA
jgi:hypothetical protein